MAETLEKVPFLWEGKNKRGEKVKGEIYAFSEAKIRADLKGQGISITKVRRKPKPLFKSKKAITSKDITIFSRQLATMMASGVPMVQALEIVGQGHENPSMQDLILGIKADIESGNTLAKSLAKHPIYFDELFCNLVEAGENSGALENLLDKIATYKEKTEAIKEKIKSAMFYPISVLTVAVIVSAILLIFVVPTFKELFEGFGAELPGFTQMVINMSEWLQRNWWILAGIIGGGLYAFNFFKKRNKTFSRFLEKISLQIPVFGDIIRKSAVARFARTLSTMFAAGVPLVDALASVSGATGNAIYAEAVMKIRDDAATGMQLNVAMKLTNMFPNMVVQMVAIGEESGALDHMLGKVADFYEAEVDNAVESLSSLMEPMIMAFLGIVVGGLVVAMYLPIFKLGAVV
jgi:type IV pilus assembly protein PilC